MRVSWCLVLAATCGLALSLPGCRTATFDRDGAGCSDEGACPPGQICSADGQCLFPCPVPDCVDDTCGCASKDGYRPYPGEEIYRCLSDGLCHLRCRDEAGNCTCPNDDLVLGPDLMCRPLCEGDIGCPNDAECVTDFGNAWFCQARDATSIP